MVEPVRGRPLPLPRGPEETPLRDLAKNLDGSIDTLVEELHQIMASPDLIDNFDSLIEFANAVINLDGFSKEAAQIREGG